MKLTKLAKMNGRKRDKMITLRVSAISLKDLDKWCKQNGMNRSDLINYIIHDFLEDISK